MPVLEPAQAQFSSRVQVLIIGAGACGTVAALAANERGAEVLILERDARPMATLLCLAGRYQPPAHDCNAPPA
jgi:fumarate reductase flavoprotein subunit